MPVIETNDPDVTLILDGWEGNEPKLRIVTGGSGEREITIDQILRFMPYLEFTLPEPGEGE